MPDNRRSARTVFAYVLAVPIFAAMYVAVFGGRLWAAVRPAVATVLGVTVIGSIYADEAIKRAPATPMRAAAALALAVVVVGTGVASPSRVAAGNDPAEAVIAAAQSYLDQPFQMGAEGPKFFDCSGLVYRAFADAGELPRIGGIRLLAAGYMRWFVSRGLYTTDEAKAQRGDLVIWEHGDHIGIYLGDGKAISALINPWGVTIHHLHTIHKSVDYFLQVNWSNNDNPPPDPGPGNGDGNPGSGNDHGTGAPGDNNGGVQGAGSADPPADNGNPDPTPPPDVSAQGSQRAYATGTSNLRTAADPHSRVIGWISRGTAFKILDTGNSPAGYVWYKIQTASGKQGWVWSYWTKPLN